MSKELESEARPDFSVPHSCSPRSAERPRRSLVDPSWQSVSKITLDLPWRPARAGWQEEEDRRRREKTRLEEATRDNRGVTKARPATMTSRVLVHGKEGRRLWWRVTRKKQDAAGPATMTAGPGERERGKMWG